MANYTTNYYLADSYASVTVAMPAGNKLIILRDSCRYLISKGGTIYFDSLINDKLNPVISAGGYTQDIGLDTYTIAGVAAVENEDANSNVLELMKHYFTVTKIDELDVETVVVESYDEYAEYITKYCNKENDWDYYSQSFPHNTYDDFVQSSHGRMLHQALPYLNAVTSSHVMEAKMIAEATIGGADWNAVEGALGHIKNKPDNSTPLYRGGYPGQIVIWDGNELYGMTKPDNLHPMDGSQILNTKAHSNLYTKFTKDYRDCAIVGSSGQAGVITGADTQFMSIDKLPNATINVSSINYTPSGSVTVNGTGAMTKWSSVHSHSHTIYGRSATGLLGGSYGNDKVLWNDDGYSGYNHATDTRNVQVSTDINHTHSASFNGTAVTLSGQTANLNGNVAQQALSVKQKSIYANCFMLIYVA